MSETRYEKHCCEWPSVRELREWNKFNNTWPPDAFEFEELVRNVESDVEDLRRGLLDIIDGAGAGIAEAREAERAAKEAAAWALNVARDIYRAAVDNAVSVEHMAELNEVYEALVDLGAEVD